MKQKLLSALFLAAAAMAVNACDRDDSTVGRKSEPTGIGKEVAKAPSAGSSETSKAGEGLGSGIAQSSKDTSAAGSPSEQTGSGAETSVSKGSPPAGSTDPSKAGTAPGSESAQTEKDTSVGGSQSERAGSGTDTPLGRSAESGDPSKAGQGASSASQSQDRGRQQDVRQAQEALKNQGQNPGPIDGIMGPQTRQALRGFQKANGLTQTGTLDAETRQKLNIDGSFSGSSGSASMGSGDSSKQQGPSSSPMSK
ncbi:MAG: peptidoglycan-binding domain-containing protein [Candidatus Binatia bacterium]